MKLLSYITLIAAFTFGINNSNAGAVTPHENVNVAIEGGSVHARYIEDSESIMLRIIAEGPQERVMIVLSGRGGEIVFKEKVVVDNRGVIMEIPMADLLEGMYFLRVKGTTINYSGRFKK